MTLPPDLFATPGWARRLLDDVPPQASPERLLRLAVDLATEGVAHGGGPFGAVIATPEGNVVEVGWNQVVAAVDSTAHAEIVAIRRAERKLATHDLRGHELYASCTPCIQCFGAIYWANLARVTDAASKEDAEARGFREGPADERLWASARVEKGLEHVRGTLPRAEALEPFRAYARRQGPVY